MSPRGVATPDVRERLFAAAERVLARGGPAALTSRAVTTEAGCAKGLLHNHFANLDDFIAQLAFDRMERVGRRVRALDGCVGRDTVGGNIRAALAGLVEAPGPAIAQLASTRPAAFAQVRPVMENGAPPFAAVQESVAGYLEAERALGRVPSGADTATMALALIGTVHHLLMTHAGQEAEIQRQLGRLVGLLVPAQAA
ncbi:TetR/AcrR family transcriptional regulator [Peterkaempfera griseoplana]|uniref:TetR/AcrR family transcriptional regulator n=1 Tax=Peterkaempfera griseoplana TaxID=66896 RepID=UPI0006E23B09|nr:TetR/AcrR family transcriptional regulator [Peterkaempfera griseoplana]